MFHLHGKGIKDQGKKSRLFHSLYTRLFKRNDAICLSKELTADIEPYIKKEPFIVANGIRNLNGIGAKKKSDVFRITWLSNLIRSKGIMDFIDALGKAKKQGASFTLSIIGKAGDISEEEIKKQLSGMQLTDSVTHLGPLYDQDKYHQLMSSDLFVFPTKYKNEALPLVILEAMQCGLPVISTKEGGIPSLIDNGKTGYLVNGNANELAEKIEYLVRNPEQSKAMGLAGKEKFDRHYTVDVFENNLINVLNKIIERNTTTSA